MKRFTETEKWRDPWFRRLSPVAKLVWVYLTDNCDRVGEIDLDLESASFHIGATVNEKHLAELVDRIQRTINGKIFIPRFIPFQYGELSENCPAHRPVLRLVHERNLTLNGNGFQYPSDSLALPMPYPRATAQEKEKEKEIRARAHARGGDDVTAGAIYALYPRKKKRPDAIRAIQKAMKKHPAAFLLERTEAYAKTQPKNYRFTPYPATWFNSEQFADDPETWTPREEGRPLSPAERRQAEIDEANREYRERKRQQEKP